MRKRHSTFADPITVEEMMKLFRILLLVCLACPAMSQQDVKVCGLGDHMEELFTKRPHTRAIAEADDQALEAWTQARGASSGSTYVIPIVFHVIHNNGEENISVEQIESAVEYLNIDFRLLNEDVADVIDDFIGLAADIEIEFRLAQLDPQGNCTNGITRTVNGLTYVGDSEMKELIQWPREKYLNIWVCAVANGAAGYALYPSSVNNPWNEDQDGIVLKHDYCGAIGTSNWTNRRTLGHEVGHWLNLRHLWGNSNDANLESNCDEDDNVNDTPNTKGWTSCAIYGESCGSLDNVQNYMEYSGCRRMFTEGQKNRMRAAAESSVSDRNNLWTQSNREATGTWLDESILCQANFTSSSQVICVGQEIQFFDDSYNGIEEWSWDFGDGTEISGTDEALFKNPIHTFEDAGQYTVTLVVGNGFDILGEIKTNYITVLSENAETPPLAQGFEDAFPGDNWWITNQNEDEAWEVTNNAAATGDQSIKLNNNTADGNFAVDEFISSTFDFSQATEVYISYKWAYANRLVETGDRLRIHISYDCGLSWILKEQHTGTTDLPTAPATNQSFTPDSSDEWLSGLVVIDNPSQLTAGFRVKFSFLAMGGNNIYVDDINIDSDAPLSVEKGPMQRFIVYPNPVTNVLTISGQSLQEFDQIQILDSRGALVSTMRVDQQAKMQIDVSKMANGLYVLRARNSTGQFSQRFVVSN